MSTEMLDEWTTRREPVNPSKSREKTQRGLNHTEPEEKTVQAEAISEIVQLVRNGQPAMVALPKVQQRFKGAGEIDWNAVYEAGWEESGGRAIVPSIRKQYPTDESDLILKPLPEIGNIQQDDRDTQSVKDMTPEELKAGLINKLRGI